MEVDYIINTCKVFRRSGGHHRRRRRLYRKLSKVGHVSTTSQSLVHVGHHIAELDLDEVIDVKCSDFSGTPGIVPVEAELYGRPYSSYFRSTLYIARAKDLPWCGPTDESCAPGPRSPCRPLCPGSSSARRWRSPRDSAPRRRPLLPTQARCPCRCTA